MRVASQVSHFPARYRFIGTRRRKPKWTRSGLLGLMSKNSHQFFLSYALVSWHFDGWLLHVEKGRLLLCQSSLDSLRNITCLNSFGMSKNAVTLGFFCPNGSCWKTIAFRSQKTVANSVLVDAKFWMFSHDAFMQWIPAHHWINLLFFLRIGVLHPGLIKCYHLVKRASL